MADDNFVSAPLNPTPNVAAEAPVETPVEEVVETPEVEPIEIASEPAPSVDVDVAAEGLSDPAPEMEDLSASTL